MQKKLIKLLDDVYEHLFQSRPLDWSTNDVAEIKEYVKKKEINMYEIMPYELFKTIEEMEQLLNMKKETINRWFDEDLMRRREGMKVWVREKSWKEEIEFTRYHRKDDLTHKELVMKRDGLLVNVGEWIEDG